MRNPLRSVGRTTLAALLALAAATCTEQPTEPGALRSAQVRFTPVFSSTFVAGLPIDNVTVTVVRPAAETLLVRNAAFALTDSVLNLDVSVALNAPSESLQVTVSLQHGASILFQGTDTLEVSAGSGGTAAPPIAMRYVGPGANIAFLMVTPIDSVLTFGDTMFFGASAIDSSDATVASFYLHWYTTPAGTPITSDGRLIAPAARKTVKVHAWTPSGAEDSVSVTFMPKPTQLLKISGDLQSDTIGKTLALPFTVEVRAADTLPVEGVKVTFAGVTPSDSIVTLQGITDVNGLATASGVLGATAGTYHWTATVAGVAPVTFQATANSGPAAAIAKVSGDAQSDTAGKTLPQPFVVRVADAGNNPVAGAMVIWTRTTGSGTPALDTVLTDGAGHAQLLYTLGAPGTDSIRAQLAGTGAFVDFTATGNVGAVKVVVISGDSQVDTVARTLAVPLVIQTQVAGGSTPVPGVTVTWAINVGSGVLSADTTVTDSLGHASVTLTLGTVSGPVEVLVDAHLGGSLGVFHFTAVAGAPSKLAFVTLPPDTVQADVALVPQPAVQLRDSFGNAVPVAGRKIRASTPYVAAAPPVKAGGIKFSASVTAGDSAVTDAAGTATFSGLKLSGAVGPEELDFTVDSLGLPTLFDSVHVVPGLPSTVIAIAGNGQSAFVDSLVATAPQVLVVDASGNGVKGVTVAFVVTAGGGVVTGDTVLTDSLGYATVGSWRMGAAFGADSLEARVVGLTPAVFTATALPPTPAILLQLVGTSVVGVGRSAPLAVRLSSPAPVGGLVVSLTSDDPSVVSVDSATVSFNQSDTLQYTTLTGVAVGTAHILASGTGYTSDTLQVTGSLNLISLPTTLNVPYGSNTSIAVTLGQPAPAGGVVVTLTSSDSTLVGIVTPTVTIPQGQTSANGTVYGTALGTVTVAATNPNYAPDASTVSTTATLNIVNGAQTIFSTIPITQTLEFRSNGALIAAPAGGVAALLTARDTACVSVAPTALIPAGLSSTTFTPSYGGSATLPCNTYVVASYPGVNADSIAVTVNPPPTITEYAQSLGSGLSTTGVYAILQAPLVGPQTVTITSLDTTKVLVADNVATDSGAPAVGLNEPTNTQYVYYGLRAKEGIVNDSAQVSIAAPGYVTQTAWVYIRAPGVALYNTVGATATTFDAPIKVTAVIGLPYANPASGLQAYQPVRPGGTLAGTVFSFQVSDTAVAKMIDSLGVGDSVRTSTVLAGAYSSIYTAGVRWAPAGAGVVTLSVSAPGFISVGGSSTTTTVSAPIITEYAQSLGSGLAATGVYTVLQTQLPDTQLVTITSLDTTKVLVSTNNAADTGAASQAMLMPKGTQYVYYGLRAKEGIVNDSAQVSVASPGYVTQTAWVYIRTPGIVLYNSVGTTATSFDVPHNITAAIGLPYTNPASGLQAYQPIRPGGTLGNVVTFRVTPGDTIAALLDSLGTPDSVRTALIPAGSYSSVYSPQVRWGPVSAGVDTLSVSAPGFIPAGGSSAVTTISAPTITEYQQTLGSGLALTGAYTILQSVLPDTQLVTITSLDTTKLLISQNVVTDTGAPAQALLMPKGTQYIYYGLRAKEGIVNDSVQVTVASAGYVTATQWVYIRQAGVQLSGPPTSLTTSSDSVNFNVVIGVPYANPVSGLQSYQPVRPGSPQAAILIRVSSPGVGRLATMGGQVDSLTVLMPAGQYQTPYGLAAGGVAFKALTTGVDTVQVSAPGFVTAAAPGVVVTVSTPGISYQGPPTVAAGLEAQGYAILGANRHGGTWVKFTSSNPGVALISRSDTIVGSAIDSVFVPDGQQYAYFWIQGVDSTSGTPIITVSANGFVDATGPVTIVAPGISLQNEVGSLSLAGADRAIYAYVGVPYAGNGSLSTYQERRPGVGPLTVTFVTSDSSKVLLTTTAGSAGTRTAQIVPGKYNTPFNKATGGVEMHPVATGSSTTSVTSPGFTPQSDASGTVNVTP